MSQKPLPKVTRRRHQINLSDQWDALQAKKRDAARRQVWKVEMLKRHALFLEGVQETHFVRAASQHDAMMWALDGTNPLRTLEATVSPAPDVEVADNDPK